MYASWIILFCSILKSMAVGDINTTDNKLQGETRVAKYGEYIGCFAQGCMEFDYHPVISEAVTPDSCTSSCKLEKFTVAAVYNRTVCACSCELLCLTQPLDERFCGLPCETEVSVFCGSYVGASFYVVNKSNNTHACFENVSEGNVGSTDNGKAGQKTKFDWYIGAGIGSAFFIVLIVMFAHFRRTDRRVVYSPRDHSRRWRADAASRQREERPPNETQTTTTTTTTTTTGRPALPPRDDLQHLSDEDSQHTGRHAQPAINGNVGDTVAESNFYHILTQDGEEESSQDLQKHSWTMESAYAYADCRAYRDSLPRSAAFVHSEPDTPRYPENNEEVEHEMISNVLYAVAKK